ncbi:MAG: hypothetical protein EPN19_15580 [Betaproteobacteria bacterium]|nr:MAG: hypothetical protein EPN19_15580 [Betaproteobacteria bacterium]
MKLTPSVSARSERALNTITGYGAGFVLVNNARHESSLIVLPERIVPWDIAGFEALALADFERLAGLDREIVLLGTGARLRFPPPALTRPLIEARIGFEVMDFQAACRTYNFLMTESRKVAAALLLE